MNLILIRRLLKIYLTLFIPNNYRLVRFSSIQPYIENLVTYLVFILQVIYFRKAKRL
jgi:hypothetical protein